MTLYDKNGQEYNVPHAVDVKEWLKEGYTLENQKDKKEVKRQPKYKDSES